jgi:hypothetical protein
MKHIKKTYDLVGMNRRVHEIEISNIVYDEYVAGAAPWALPSRTCEYLTRVNEGSVARFAVVNLKKTLKGRGSAAQHKRCPQRLASDLPLTCL